MDKRALTSVDFHQLAGRLDFNGFDLGATGTLAVRNGNAGTLVNFDGRIIGAKSILLEGTSKDTLLNLNPLAAQVAFPKGWSVTTGASDTIIARFASIGYSKVDQGTAYAVHSQDAGGNNGWIFPAPPAVTLNPKNASVLAGQPASFSVSASGLAPVTYQWTRDDKEIPAAKDSVYQLSAARRADSAATFACRIANAGGSVTSSPARLFVSFPAPSANPSPQTFSDSLRVKLSTSVPGASLFYARGGAPFQAYSGGILLTDSTTLRAFAALGPDTTVIVSWSYPKRQSPKTPIPAPSASPKSRDFPDSLRITLTANTPGASILYTLDGSDPGPGPRTTLFAAPILLDSSATLNAISVSGGDTSATLSESYYLVPDTLRVSHRGGDYAMPIEIELLASTPKAAIYYTLDGSAPGPESGLGAYKGPFILDSNATLKAVAVAGRGTTLRKGPLLIQNYTFVLSGKKVLAPGARLDLSANYSLRSAPEPSTYVIVDLLRPDSLTGVRGFRDIQYALRLSAPGSDAFPKVTFVSPQGEPRSLYVLDPKGAVEYIAMGDTTAIMAPGTYFLAVDTLPPRIQLLKEASAPGDSTRAEFRIEDNVSSLMLDLDRSDDPGRGFLRKPIRSTDTLVVILKNPPGMIQPLSLRLRVGDHRLSASFPAEEGARHFLAQFSSAPLSSPALFGIGRNPDNLWDLIAVPLALDPPLTLARLRANNADNGLQTAVWSEASGIYRYPGEDESIAPEASVWVASRKPLTSLLFPSLKTSPRGTDSYRVTLHPGWNQVANPTLSTLYWPIPRTFGVVYDASPAKGPQAYRSDAESYVKSDSLEPWRGYYAYYKGGRDTVLELRTHPAVAPTVKAAAEALAQGIDVRMTLGVVGLRLGADANSRDGWGVEDELQPPPQGERGPKLWALRQARSLATDLQHWSAGGSFAWRIINGAPAGKSAGDSASPPTRIEVLRLPVGYAAWAVSRTRGMRFRLEEGGTLPTQPGLVDSLDVFAGPAAELDARLAGVPTSVGTFSAFAMADRGGISLRLRTPRPLWLHWVLISVGGREVESGDLRVLEGVYRLAGSRRHPAGLYLIRLEWTASGSEVGAKASGRLDRKILIP